MNRSTILPTILFGTIFLTAQSPTQPTPPKKVIEEYFKMEANGGRLTSQGWNNAGSLFVRPVPRPKDIQIRVIYDYSVWNPVINGSTAEVTVGYIPGGRIDSALRYTPSTNIKEGVTYRLALTDKHWEPGRDGAPAKEVTGALEWRLEGSIPVVWVTGDRAIKYVREVRDKSNDPVTKGNADKTLKVLEKQQRQ